MLLRFPDGTYSYVRCGASNRCPYCAYIAAAENIAVVMLDAQMGDWPTWGLTLTTRSATFDMDRFRRAVEFVLRWLRREYGRQVEYLALMEWTTGIGGHGRLPHSHVLVKGMPGNADPREVERGVRRVWKRNTGAWRVEARPLRSAAGAIAYTVAHHHKTTQAPPQGWSGKRMRPSKGYFECSIIYRADSDPEGSRVGPLRREARRRRGEALALMRVRDELIEQGVDPGRIDPDELLAMATYEQEASAPVVVKVRRTAIGGVLLDIETGELVEPGRVVWR